MTSPYQNPWSRNPWSRNPYANARLDTTKAAARKARRDLMLNVTIWSAPVAMSIIWLAILAFR